MLTFPLPTVTKKMFVDSTKKHRAEDRISQLYGYWDSVTQRGCAIGCAIMSINALAEEDYTYSSHRAVSRSLGIPIQLAFLEDDIFENLPTDLAEDWPVRFAEAIPENADLSRVWPTLAVWMLREMCLSYPALSDSQKAKEMVERVAAGMESNWINDDSDIACEAAQSMLRSTIIAQFAVECAASCAGDDPADAASNAAHCMASSRVGSIDAVREGEEYTAEYVKIADKLIELMVATPSQTKGA